MAALLCIGCIIIGWGHAAPLLHYYIGAIMAALLRIGCIMAALLLAGAVRPHCCLALMREWLLQYYQPLIPLAGSTRIV